ncbi:hypothetical protein QM467_12395 [Rhodoblastus sp. 17X3]|uniref:hypothetical protein n=1 Tax=Rhodoblastus sp. 17X3 TaxID=3047026 RepID=UPI0024B7F3E0|nr:hypothetical protein [Rhodoblastus sp. 17X3]MDI9848858.1 hypothetical protein [Rhodoblastus sp. 17X3]
MVGIGHDTEEVVEAWFAANIFGRRAVGAVDKARIVERRVCRTDGLDEDRVAPVVAKIIGVSEFGDAGVQEFAELGVSRVADLDEVALRIGNAMSQPASSRVSIVDRLKLPQTTRARMASI